MVRDHRSASTIRNHRREPQEAVWGGLLCVPDVLIPISSSGNGGIGQHAAGQGAPQHRERRRSPMCISVTRVISKRVFGAQATAAFGAGERPRSSLRPVPAVIPRPSAR